MGVNEAALPESTFALNAAFFDHQGGLVEIMPFLQG